MVLESKQNGGWKREVVVVVNLSFQSVNLGVE